MIDSELSQRLLLGLEAGEEIAFAQALFGGETGDDGLRGRRLRGRALRKEAAGLEASLAGVPEAARVVEGGLEKGRCGPPVEQTHGGVDSEGAAVVVWVAAFIGMGEDSFRPESLDLLGDLPGKRRQVEDTGLVGEGVIGCECRLRLRQVKLAGGAGRQRREAEGGMELVAPGISIGLKALKAMSVGVETVGRSAVCGAKQTAGRHLIKPAPEREDLVVRMGQYYQEPGKGCLLRSGRSHNAGEQGMRCGATHGAPRSRRWGRV